MSNIIEEIQNLIEKEFELIEAIYQDEEDILNDKIEIISSIRKYLSENEYVFLKKKIDIIKVNNQKELDEIEAERFVLEAQNKLLKENIKEQSNGE